MVSAIEAVSPVFFEDRAVPPPVGSTEFSPQVWKKVKGQGIAPSSVGDVGESDELRMEFLAGARLLGFELVDLDDFDAIEALHSGDIDLDALQPQQLLMADALNAGQRKTVIEVPRRSAKTTTILAWALGRCVSRPRYKVTFSAQTGAAGVQMLDDWARDMLDRVNPPDDLDIPPWLRGTRTRPKAQLRADALFGEGVIPFGDSSAPAGRGFKILRGNTKAGIYFDNGSSLVIVRPEASAYRGRAADVSWIDEAQEIEAAASDDLLAGILPLQDTRPNAMVVVSGTAGEVRVGLFWKLIEQLRASVTGVGGVDFAAPDDTPWETIADEDAAMKLLALYHPGIDTLTNLEAMRQNYRSFSLPKWAREYLSLWPETFGVSAIPNDWWTNAYLEKRIPIPSRVAFGFAIRPNGSVASIAAAWRNSRGVAYVEVIAHESNTGWVPKRGQGFSIKYRGSTLAYDAISSECKATVTEMNALRPKPRTRILTYKDQAAGCVQILRDLERGKIRHFGQIALNAAASHAAKREIRGDNGTWFWGADEPEADITALNAVTSALRNWDQYFAGKTSTNAPIMGN